MRILHTSDWHLGQNFFNKNRRSEHQAFLDWLLTTAKENDVNAIIVAGDIFDTSTPPSYARELYNQFVVGANKLDCQLILLGGNHDSVSVLNESKNLLKYLRADVVAHASGEDKEQVVSILDSDGQVGALVCAIPFIRPQDVMSSQSGVKATEKQQQLGEAIKAHYHKLYLEAQSQQAELESQLGKKVPIIATGHLTALGVTQSESVRDIYIGTLEGFASDAFPPADYIALGHIHRPQIVGKKENIRYSGSPIPLSFDELKSNKQVVMVEFENTTPNIHPIAVPNFQPMASLKGDLHSIEEQLAAFKQSEQTIWLSIEVSEQDFLSDLQQRIAEMVKGLNVEVLQLRRARTSAKQAIEQKKTETLAELKPQDVFKRRLELETLTSEQEQARIERISLTFGEILNQVELDGEEQH
ncbi:exonuclease subunit SbcD [Vibrio ishigakensis]|uniref:exonuclease subunit SbcD n=1 Tax=Vibrio ishigakensis TaxID=1481914 RepID=UPI0021C4767D|nr:exonuclease subunit SbcD [Vibrio ishigakensis]